MSEAVVIQPDVYRQQRMVALLLRLAPREGYTQSALENVRFMRANQPLPRTPVLYEPSIVIVCQGRKRGFFGDKAFVYDARHYLVLSVPLPFATETEATPEEPMLAVALRLDLTTTADLMLAIEEGHGRIAAEPESMIATPLTGKLSDSVLRLLEALSTPLEADILGPSLVREICFRVLMGEQGGAMRAALVQQGNFGKIARALRRIHQHYDAALDVSRLAGEAGMSVPAFHAHFKAVTQTSPIQYLKSTRLHQARLMMIRHDVTAAAAAIQVGYESPSQFSREFKRFFGRPPGEEIAHMKQTLSLTPAAAFSHYVTAQN